MSSLACSKTHDYARAYMLDFGVPHEDLERRWEARHRRQHALPLVDYTAFICETAMGTPFGGPTFLEQLRYLLEVSGRGVGIRIVPEHQPHAALLQSWMLLEFPNSPPIVHVELLRSAVFLHGDETMLYTDHLAKLSEIAFSAAESRDILGKLIERRGSA